MLWLWLFLLKSAGTLLFAQIFIVSASDNVVCYYLNSNYNTALPEDLNASLCTHINYAFVSLDDDGNLFLTRKKVDIGKQLINRIVKLKSSNSDLKVLLSIGGVDADIFASVAADAAKRANLVTSAKYYIQTYSFDGLDIDWEKPTANDTDSFVAMLSDLRKEFDNYGWLLTAAVYPSPSAGYNATGMSQNLDMFNIMSYNFYGAWSAYTGQNSPLFESSVESSYERTYLNVASAIKNWINTGIPKDKLNAGLAFYGRSFTLADSEQHGLHAPITGAGTKPTPSYAQICENYNNWTTVWDDEQKNPYKFVDDQWLGYDNPRSVREKVQYIRSLDIGGAMIWHIGGDDVNGECGLKQELLQIINEGIKRVRLNSL